MANHWFVGIDVDSPNQLVSSDDCYESNIANSIGTFSSIEAVIDTTRAPQLCKLPAFPNRTAFRVIQGGDDI